MFYSPRSKKELLDVLNLADNKTYIIAGGTDLLIHLKNSRIIDYSVIDITKIPELHEIKEDNDNVFIGSTITMSELCSSQIIKEKFKALYQAAYNLGSKQIRNRATIGGNISNASQSADCSLVLFTFNAKVKILNKNGEEKIIPIEDFIIGREKTILSLGEVVTEIIIPKINKNSLFGKIGARKAVTISKISCAISYTNDRKLENVRIFLGAVGIKPVRAELLETYLNGLEVKEIDLEKLQSIACEEIEKAIPNRKSKYYKRVAIQGLIEDMVREI